jgi:hypothetical protein
MALVEAMVLVLVSLVVVELQQDMIHMRHPRRLVVLVVKLVLTVPLDYPSQVAVVVVVAQALYQAQLPQVVAVVAVWEFTEQDYQALAVPVLGLVHRSCK